MSIRITFMGTPAFAVPSLRELAKAFQITGIITQPDRLSGRGRKMIPSPVKTAGEKLNLPIYQPHDTNDKQSLDRIASWEPDLICVVAFGQILSPELLSMPAHACINLHASLLPRWRGASPINAAILAGDLKSGVTVMKMSEGLDDGPILNQASTPIDPNETAGSLSDRLAILGAELFVKTIPGTFENRVGEVGS
jgi:methionyl-tRNA formyltransferase